MTAMTLMNYILYNNFIKSSALVPYGHLRAFRKASILREIPMNSIGILFSIITAYITFDQK